MWSELLTIVAYIAGTSQPAGHRIQVSVSHTRLAIAYKSNTWLAQTPGYQV